MNKQISLIMFLICIILFQNNICLAQNDTIPKVESKFILIKTLNSQETNIKNLGEILIDNGFDVAEIQKDFGIVKSAGKSIRGNVMSKYRIVGRCKANGDIIIHVEYRWEKTLTLGGFQDVATDWTVANYSRNKKQQEYFNFGVKIAKKIGNNIQYFNEY